MTSSPDCSVLIAMHSSEMVFVDHFDGLILADLPDFLEIRITELVYRLTEVRLNLKPLEVLDDDHSFAKN